MPKPAVAEIARESLGEFDAGGGGIARADDGDQRPRQDVALAAHREQRRRDRRSSAAAADNPARPARRNSMPRARDALSSLSASSREQMRAGPDAPPRRARPGRAASARARAAVIIDQVAEGARADIVAADQPQPIEPLLVAQSHAVVPRRPRPVMAAASPEARRDRQRERFQDFAPILPSLPLSSRRDIGAVHDPQRGRSARETAPRRSGRRERQQRDRRQCAGDQRGAARNSGRAQATTSQMAQKISAAGQ